ncbi:hypothetical protein GCM10023175_47200 [Pseudonocardia xishanensis]|uniref:Uncharacterized protein n=1 Tax=Pseudonocardia xishanensis TaxID=630995 RepID=A0ABP8RXH7_9PSEU
MPVVGVALFLADRQAAVSTGNPLLLPSLLLVGALVIPVSFVAWIDDRNPAFDVPTGVLVGCGLLGGLSARRPPRSWRTSRHRPGAGAPSCWSR